MAPADRDMSAVPSLAGSEETGIRAVLFDFGGVMSTSPFEAFARYEAETGLPAGFLRELNARNHHSNAWALLERGEATIPAFIDLFEAEARELGHQVSGASVLGLLGGDIRPGMVDAVRRCRDRYLTAVATNNFLVTETPPGAPDPASALSDRFAAVLGLFDEIVESSKIGVRKPEVGFYEACCARLGVAPAQAVFIDDLGVNLKPARQLGMTTIKFASEDQALTELEAVLGIALR